jgi:hypothetical protein
MVATNKRLLISESHGDSNCCTPCRGKHNQHGTYASHASPRMPGVHFQRWTDPIAPEKKGSRHNPQPSWVIHKSATQFLSQHSHWSSNESQTSIDSRLLGLPSPYHRHAIGTFNTCSRVPTSRSLTDTGGGYHIENLRIATSLSPPFPSEGSTDPPNGPDRSQIIQTTFTHLTGEGNKP